jgi:hypothetical protein
MAFLIRQIAHDRAAGQGRSTAADGSAEWRYDLRRRIAARTQGRVVGLKVEVIDGRLIVQGRSQSYYGKQLACAAALDLLKTLDSTLVTEVELNVEVLNSRQCIVKATNAGGWRRTKLAPSRE